MNETAESRNPGQVAAFLMTAWKGLVGLEEAVEGLAGSESTAALASLETRSGELARSAEDYGFPELARLAAGMESLARVFPPLDHAGADDVLQLLGDTLTVLPMVLDNIAAEASDDIPQVPGLQWRYDVEVPAAQELAAQRRLTETPGPVDAALARLPTADPEMISFFVPEAREHLKGMADRLADLRRGNSDPAAEREALNDFFRHAHTVKGAAYTVGCPEIGDLAHGLEELWVAIRQGDRSLTPRILGASDRSVTLVEHMIDRLDGVSGRPLQGSYDDVTARLEELRRPAPGEPASPRPANVPPAPPPVIALPPPDPGRTAKPPNAGSRNSEHPAEDPRPSGLGPPGSGYGAPPVSTPGASLAAEVDIEPVDVSASRSTLRVDLDRLESVLDSAGEMAVAHGTYVDQLQRLEGLHRQLDDCRRRMVRTVEVFQDRHLHPVIEPAPSPPSPSRDPEDRGSPGIDVAERFAELELDRYDDFNILARRIGELSSDLSEIQNELEQMLVAARRGSARVQSLTRRLRIGVGKVRRVPVGRLFARFSRLARKAAEEAGKSLDVQLSGERVELDNAIIERVAEALTHLVQNAVHHGVEDPETRRAAGKSPTATLRFVARARGRRVHLEVSDDGAGIDVRALKERAVQAGLKTAAEVEALDDDEALDLVYLPGLTTSARVTTAVGRGVGMDAVRHSVLRLGGEVRIHTQPGDGTRFVLELPVSLLVTEALVVRVGDSSFALPLPQVDRIQALFERHLPAGPDGGDPKAAVVDGRPWPLVHLADRLALTSRGPVDEVPGLLAVSVLVRAPKPAALVVDEVVGIEELVIKPLGAFLEGASFLSGATLDTRGRILLLLDLVALVEGGSRPRAETPAAPVELPEAPPRVLLADDSLSVRRVLGRALQQAGYEVLTARDGAEALELMLDQPVDAVVTDLEMPQMSGYELVDDLRTRASTRDVPVWVVTTRAGARHADLARELGAVGYLAKPVDAELLVEQLESVLRREDTPP